MRFRSDRQPIISGLLILISLAGSACAGVRLTHLDNTEFSPVITAELADTAWIAVDSCAAGIHALVEMEIESSPTSFQEFSEVRLSRRFPLELEYAPGYASVATYGRMEGPFCLKTSQWRDGHGINPAFDATESCTYLYTAEFTLERMPDSRQSFKLQYNRSTIEIAQR